MLMFCVYKKKKNLLINKNIHSSSDGEFITSYLTSIRYLRILASFSVMRLDMVSLELANTLNQKSSTKQLSGATLLPASN